MATDPRIRLTVAQTIAAVRGRDLGCEGIPMYLALHGAAPAPAGDPRRVHGERLAALLPAIHAEVTRQSAHPRTRAERRQAMREAQAVTEGAGLDRTEPDAEPDADADADDAEVARAVPEPERLLAEAVAVLAHAMLTDPPVVLELDDAVIPAPVDGPLSRTATALREGRYVTVVNYHNTPASTASRTRAELMRWGRDHSPVRPADLARLFARGTWPHPRPPLIPVLYEGYRNNVEIAGPAVRDAGLVGWFFLIKGFLDAVPGAQEEFALAHDIALAPEERGAQRKPLAMSWAQAGALSPGHVVTAHTTHHAPAHAVNDPAEIETEIGRPAAAVRRATGVPAPAHAWLYGSDLAHDGRHAEELHRAGYRWVFSNTGIDDVAGVARARR